MIHVLYMQRDFKIKWIRFILRRVCDMSFYLKKPMKIMKKMVHQVMSYPMLDRLKTTKTLALGELIKKTLEEWDERGLKINNVTNIEIKFGIHVISHEIYNSSRPNNAPCEAVDLAYKVVKKNLSFDLSKL